MKVAQSRRNADGHAKKSPHVHRGAEELTERLAAGIFEHQHWATAVVHELQRLCGPRAIQLILQSEFVSEAIEV